MLATLNDSEIKLINRIISNLYNTDIPLHTRLINYLNELIQLIYFDRATILFFYKDSNDIYHKHSSISINFDPDKSMVKQYDTIYCQMDDTLPVFDQDNFIIFKSSEFFNQEARMKNRYWTEYLIPSNCIYSLEGNLKLSNNMLKSAFNIYRGEEKSDFTAKDEFIMSLFQVHLSNVLKDYGNKSTNSDLFFMLENHNCVAFATLDSNFQIISCNSTFKEIIRHPVLNDNAEVDTSFINNRILTLCSTLAQRVADNPDNKSIESKIENAPFYIVISKLGEAKDNSTEKYSCMIYDLSYFYNKTLDQTKEKFSLTVREFDILKAVLSGKTNEEIATERYLALPTVKKCLASIYNKMDITSQKQIFSKLNIQE